MKTCIPCTNSVEDAAKTCPFCGEASWAAKAPAPKQSPASVAAPEPVEAVDNEPPKKRWGKK